MDTKVISDEEIAEIKEIRVLQQQVNDRIKKLLGTPRWYGAEATLARRAGQTVRHWLGEALGIIREARPDLAHPYPQADNPESPAIAPPADV